MFLNLDLTFLSTQVFGGFCAIFLNVVVSGRIFLKVYSTPVFFFTNGGLFIFVMFFFAVVQIPYHCGLVSVMTRLLLLG